VQACNNVVNALVLCNNPYVAHRNTSWRKAWWICFKIVQRSLAFIASPKS